MINESQGKPLVSLILLSYNSGDYIFDALSSYLEQDYEKIEIIISDDGSKIFDNEQIERYIERKKASNILNYEVTHHSQNMGTVKNANYAIKHARGEFIKLLGADDALYGKDTITKLVEFMREHSLEIAFGKAMQCDTKLREMGVFLKEDYLEKTQTWPTIEQYKLLCCKNQIAAPAAVFSRSFFEKYGLFDEDYRLLEDWPTWLRILRDGCQIGYASHITAVKYRMDAGVSTGINYDFLKDKRLCFEKEIRPYKKLIGPKVYWKSKINLAFYNSLFLRRIYCMIKRD